MTGITINWQTFLTALVPAVFALLGSYLAIRSQVKMKSVEAKAQSALKAKELIFSAYQKRWEKAEKDADELLAVSTQFYEKSVRGDKNGLLGIFANLLSYQMTALNKEDFDSLVEELREAGIADKHQRKIDTVQSHLAMDIVAFRANLDNLPDEEVALQLTNYMHGLTTALAINSRLHGYLYQKKAEDLFSSHIKSSALSKK
jgi:hypothetical protein